MPHESHFSPAALLSEELRKRAAKNPRYSLRAFAKQIGVSPGELSEVISGKRRLTLKSALKISRALGLSPVEAEAFLAVLHREVANSAGVSLPSDDAGTALERRQLSTDLFHLVSDWYCFAIVNLAETRDFSFSPAHIAKRLGITPTEAKLALDRLQRVGLLERIRGKLRMTPDFVLAPEGIPSAAVRKFHAQMLEKAKDALESQSLEERDVGGITFAVDPAQVPALKKEIHALLDRWSTKLDRLDRRRKTEVYHFETALFRLSHPHANPSRKEN